MSSSTQTAYLGKLYAKSVAARRDVVATHLKVLAHAFENGKLDNIDQLLAAGACRYAAECLGDALGEKPEPDYFGRLVERARASAAKASIKFPQPSYVTLKIAEEAGEVVRGAVHYAEGRMEWSEVEGEIVQLLAMLIRFVTEGDQINGVHPPALATAPAVAEGRPATCRNRLRDEGKPYPKSGCNVCKTGGIAGCPHERSTAVTEECDNG